MSNLASLEGRRRLVVFPGALGDTVLLLPALARLAEAGERVTVASRSDWRPILDRVAGLAWTDLERREIFRLFVDDDGAPDDASRAFFEAFDRIDMFHGASVDGVRARLRLATAGDVRLHAFRPPEPAPMATYWASCLDASIELPFVLADGGAAAAPRSRERMNKRPTLVVHPGSGGREKRWSREGFEAVACRFRGRGWSVRLLAGPAERDDGAPPLDAAFETPRDVADLLDVLCSADLYLGCDSGPTHVASVCGLPGLAVFGPTDPVVWGPIGPAIYPLRLEPWSREGASVRESEINLVIQRLERMRDASAA